jgi:hypothetical protein
LAEAAVATGAVAMPVKLPAPDLGTAAQPGPKSLAAVAGEEDIAVGEETGEDVAPDAAGEDEDELHAAAPRLRLTARPDRARRRYFMCLTP